MRLKPSKNHFFFGVEAAAAGLLSLSAGALPITPLSGQILNAGHFSQPVTMAIGQSVMGFPSWFWYFCLSLQATEYALCRF